MSGLVFGLGVPSSGPALANGEIDCTDQITVTAVASATVNRTTIQDKLNLPEPVICLSGNFQIDSWLLFGDNVTFKGVGNSSIENITADEGVFGNGQGASFNITIEDLTLKNSKTAVSAGGNVLVKNSIFTNNSGGAILAGGTVDALGSIFSGNSSEIMGGAIFSYGGQVTVSDSTFSGNSSSLNGGAISGYGVEISNSTFIDNSAKNGGAVFSDNLFGTGTILVSNSTFVNNAATEEGGGVYATSGIVLFSTFVNNLASTPLDEPADTPGNAIYKTDAGYFELFANIFAGSSPHPQLGFGAVISEFVDRGGNVFSTSAGTETDIVQHPSSVFGASLAALFGSATPLLATHDPNTYGTQTIALVTGSPALDVIPQTTFDQMEVFIDQRGATRTHPADAGAFEGAVVPITTGTYSPPADFTILKFPTGITKPGSEVKVTGANLNLIREVYVSGAKVKIKKKSPTSLVFTAPGGLTGLVDVRFVSAASQYNAFRALDFGSSAVSGTKARTVVGGFAANSTRLSMKMKREIRAFLKTNSELSSVTCMGFTSEPATALDTALSKARGQVTCNYINKLNPDLKVKVVQGRHTELPGSKIRRVRITMQ
jgi:predicted outer membrane repeat protein